MDRKTYTEGFVLSFENAKRLFKTAELLEALKEFAIANSLLILSAEEAMKSFSVLTRHDFPENILEDVEKSFEGHKHKLETMRTLVALSQVMQQMADFMPATENKLAGKSKKEIEQLEGEGVDAVKKWLNSAKDKRGDLSQEDEWWKHAKTMKEKGFYVGFSKGKWSSPESIKKPTYLKTKKYVGDFLAQMELLYSFDLDEKNVLKVMTEMKGKLKKSGLSNF